MTMPSPPAAPQEPDYYALIGVAPDSATDEIRRVYGDRVRAAMEANDRAQFEQLVAAFDILKDDDKRAAYDLRRINAPLPSSPSEPPAANRTQMNATAAPVSDATQVLPPSQTVLPGGSGTATAMGGDRTQMFTRNPGQVPLPTVCAINLSPCPLLVRQVLPDEGFCPECGVQLGAALGDAPAVVLLPLLRDETGREYPLRAGENTVGRDGADVMLPDKSVSRRHARLSAAPGMLSVEDLGSTNGTKHGSTPLVAGQRVTLSDGDRVQFGGVKLVAVVPPADNLLALPSGSSGAERTILPALAAPEGVNTSARVVGKDGKEYTLTGANTSFGRRAGNTVVLTGDQFVSGSHGAITYEGGTFRVVDLGSTNGSKLNGKRLAPNAPQVLHSGDEIIFGQTVFTFHGPG